MEKERLSVERDNFKMSNKPILWGTSTLVQRARSVSVGAITHLHIDEKELSWTEYLKFLLLRTKLRLWWGAEITFWGY